jgi:hypothetical protein
MCGCADPACGWSDHAGHLARSLSRDPTDESLLEHSSLAIFKRQLWVESGFRQEQLIQLQISHSRPYSVAISSGVENTRSTAGGTEDASKIG